jgi:hypothetical protein
MDEDDINFISCGVWPGTYTGPLQMGDHTEVKVEKSVIT